MLPAFTIWVKTRTVLSDILPHAASIHGSWVAERCVSQWVPGIRGFRAVHDLGEAANGVL
ncbi:MAG: hypothetical protein DRJ50_00845 [Actinobacteria bacterium]|nr:MAG: hypothetical protein DRJ50_00845 [Actinomycetota bacterium]